VFCVYLITNSDLYHSQHKLIGFYNREEKCLQRGTDWVFKSRGLTFVFKGLSCKHFCYKYSCIQDSQLYRVTSNKCGINTVVPPDDEPIEVRKMYRL